LKVTVCVLGLGINPLLPRIGPSRPTSFIISGVATAISKSSQPSLIFSTRSASPTYAAPAAFASSALSPFAKTRIFFAPVN